MKGLFLILLKFFAAIVGFFMTFMICLTGLLGWSEGEIPLLLVLIVGAAAVAGYRALLLWLFNWDIWEHILYGKQKRR